MRITCAGAVVCDADGRILVIRRAQQPWRGTWSLPGGRVETGESPAEAARREVREETGLDVEMDDEIGRIEIPHGDLVYDVTDFRARLGGAAPTPVAGDDADDARWVTRAEMAALDTSPGLVDTLESWGAWDTETGRPSATAGDPPRLGSPGHRRT